MPWEAVSWSSLRHLGVAVGKGFYARVEECMGSLVISGSDPLLDAPLHSLAHKLLG